MNTTQNLNLGKPLVSEKYDISVFNSNADKIDSAIKELQDKTTAASADKAGVVMLNDDTESDSTTTAATANSVKKVSDKISDKVDKVPGKSLSSNDLTNDLKANYNAAFEHSVSDHARIDATLTQASSANGNIKINGNETVVYTHPAVHSAMMITEDSSHRFVTDEEKSSYADKYTRNEVDNKFSTLETSIDWKESVETFADIAKTYPNPQDGWTVNVKDTDYTYRYNGAAWVTISANAIPKATSAVDGLLSKEDKVKLDDADVKKHMHSNKSVLDGITAEDVAAWNSKDVNVTAEDIGALPVSGGTMDTDAVINLRGDTGIGTGIHLETTSKECTTHIYPAQISSPEIDGKVLKYNGNDTDSRYVRPDKHTKIYNNFDVYAKGTTANPLLKVRDGRVDILKTDNTSSITGVSDAHSVAAISSDKTRFETDSFKIVASAEGSAGKGFEYEGGNFDIKAGNVFYVGISGTVVTLPGTNALSSTTYTTSLSVSKAGINLKAVNGVHLDAYTNLLYQATPFFLDGEGATASFLSFTGNGLFLGYRSNYNLTHYDLNAIDRAVSADNVRGIQIEYGETHIYTEKMSVGQVNNYFMEARYDVNNNAQIKFRTNDSGANLVFENTDITVNANVKFLINGSNALSWSSKTTSQNKTLLQNNSLQNVLAALIRKTNLTQNDI